MLSFATSCPCQASWQAIGKPSEATLQLLDEIKHYKIHAEPYHVMPLDGDLETLKNYWKAIRPENGWK